MIKRVIIIIIIIFFIIIFIRFLAAPVISFIQNPSQAPQIVKCIFTGGTWNLEDSNRVVQPFAHCTYEYKDGGKICTSNNDCKGVCFFACGINDTIYKNDEGYIIGECSRSSGGASSGVHWLETPIKEAPENWICSYS